MPENTVLKQVSAIQGLISQVVSSVSNVPQKQAKVPEQRQETLSKVKKAESFDPDDVEDDLGQEMAKATAISKVEKYY
jgi:hypothetical protein